MKTLFELLNADHSDRLNQNEYKKYFHIFKLPESHAKILFDIIDTDKSGEILYKEYYNFFSSMIKIDDPNNNTSFPKYLLNTYNKDSYLNMEEFVHYHKVLAYKVNIFNRRKQFNELGTYGNRKIDFEEVMSKLKFGFQQTSHKKSINNRF